VGWVGCWSLQLNLSRQLNSGGVQAPLQPPTATSAGSIDFSITVALANRSSRYMLGLRPRPSPKTRPSLIDLLERSKKRSRPSTPTSHPTFGPFRLEHLIHEAISTSCLALRKASHHRLLLQLKCLLLLLSIPLPSQCRQGKTLRPPRNIMARCFRYLVLS
jgi:hypothetical protein